MKIIKRQIRLGDLLGNSEPYASFHDATLHKIVTDYANHNLRAEFELCVGNPDGTTEMERERRRKGHLKVSGLVFWTLDLPDNNDKDKWEPLWLTADGVLSESTTDVAQRFNPILDPEMYAWFLFFSDINAFGYLAAREAEFIWENV